MPSTEIILINLKKIKMNTSIKLLVILALFFAGCGDKKSNAHEHDNDGNHINTESTHEHEDGSVHENHTDHEHTQEEFKINGDTSAIKSDSATVKSKAHSHKDGSHKH